MDRRLRLLNSLRSFESAARYQSYSQAADELCVTQAAVSQQLRQLELALDTKLFVRRGRYMQLTSNGERLQQVTHQAFIDLLRTFDKIQCEGIAGSLTIASPQSFSTLWLMPRLFKFSVEHPEINIRFSDSDQLDDVQSGHIDLAIWFREKTHQQTAQTNHNIGNELTYEFFGEDDIFPVCSPAVAKEMHLQEPKDILNCWLVNISRQGGSHWQAWFEAAGVQHYQQHNLWTEVSAGDMALSAVLSGHGCTLAAKSLFSQYVETGKLIIPFNIKHPQPLRRHLVFNPNSAKKKRIAIFADWLKTEMMPDE